MSRHEVPGEARRLEQLWSGAFGEAYIERNARAGEGREPFWRELLAEFPAERVLEVVGGNLRWIVQTVPPRGVVGIDVNEAAAARMRERLPGPSAAVSLARALPFRPGSFDLVFTVGVLIHTPEETLPVVMGEIVRCSRRYVLCAEYYAAATVEVPYRGEQGACFKRDYGDLYQALFPALRLCKQGFLDGGHGWDDVTYWVFEKTGTRAGR